MSEEKRNDAPSSTGADKDKSAASASKPDQTSGTPSKTSSAASSGAASAPATDPAPAKALVDGPQALRLDELPLFVEDMQIAREAYLKRRAAHERARSAEPTAVP